MIRKCDILSVNLHIGEVSTCSSGVVDEIGEGEKEGRGRIQEVYVLRIRQLGPHTKFTL